ncbi:MAG TPA: IclR family transcriptional regulator [Eoetvoesiella sp.]
MKVDSEIKHERSSIAAKRENIDAVSRSLAILDVFQINEQSVSLAELSRRLSMNKTTVLRTARTLARADYLSQTDDGRWRLGPAAGWLGVRYQTSFDVNNVIDSLLRRLSDQSGETAAFFVREGNWRTCVARVDRSSLIRVHVRTGEKLPLDKGASGRVLLAFSGQQGPVYDDIRRVGYYISVRERDPNMSSIAIPVFGAGRRLFGALCVSGQAERLPHDVLAGHLKRLINAEASLSRALASNGSDKSFKSPASWHP